MSIADLGLWQWLALIQHELLLFAGIFFLIGAADDLAADAVWLWLRLTGKATAIRRKRAALVNRPLHGPAAVLIPAWNEAAVIGQTVAHILASWPHPLLRLYVGCYRNDPATLAAADLIETGPDGLARIRYGDGTEVTVRPNSEKVINRTRSSGLSRAKSSTKALTDSDSWCSRAP